MNTRAMQKTNQEADSDEDEDELQIEYETEEDEKEIERQAKREIAREDANDDDDDDDSGDEDDEREQYSKRVQKRIDKLKYEYHEEKRKAEEANRMREEAINYTQHMQSELQRLRQQVEQGEGILYQQAEGRLDAQISNAKAKLRAAHETADPDAIVEAQTELSNLVAEKARIETYKPRKRSPEQNQQQQYYQQPQQPQQPQPQQRTQPSERALKWKEKNDWFGNDQKMTAVAYAVHADVIQKGVQPDSEEYYRQIDQEMRKVFPQHFGNSEGKADNVVAAPTRQQGKKPRTVRLTQTQLNFCKRLGISPEQYAKEMLKQEK